MVPRINVHDGKHRMIIAEEGERVLTKDQNREYESQHPDARQEPMKAEVYDLGGALDYIKENAGEHKNPGLAKAGLRDAAAPAQDTPLMDQVPLADCGGRIYDKGGTLPAQDNSMWDKIKNRAGEIYEQAKQAGGNLMNYPKDTASSEVNAINQKAKMVEDLKRQGEAQAGTLPEQVSPATAPVGQDNNPLAKYGSRTGEKRLDAEGNIIVPTTPEGMGVQKMRPPTPAGLQQVFDEGGTVQKDDEAQKDAALQQAIQEAKEAPISHGSAQDREEAEARSENRFPEPKKPARMQYDTENPVDESRGVGDMSAGQMSMKNAPLKAAPMNTENTTGLGLQPTPASTGVIPAPRPSKMNYAPAPAPEAPPAAPDPMEIIQQDKLAAMKKGTAGLSDLGTSLIHERLMKDGKVDAGPDIAGGPTVEDAGAAPKGAKTPAEDWRMTQEKILHDKMLGKSGESEQERFQAEKDLAELKRRTPWGSPENRPGIMGKVGHVMSRIGQAALIPTAPYLAAAIPGTQAQLAGQEAIGEQGVESAQKKELTAAQTKAAEAAPELKEQQFELLQKKHASDMLKAGFKQNPTTGEFDIPVPYEELTPQQQSLVDKNESINTLNSAKSHEQEAKAVMERYKADPNNAQNQVAFAKIQEEAKRTAIAAGKLGLDQKRFLADYYGLGEDGQPIPGVATTPEGKPVGPKITGKDEGGKVFDKYAPQVDKLAAPYTAAYQRSGLLVNNLKTASKQGDALVAPELLSIAAGGAGSGLRMNEAEIARVIGGRSVWDALVAKANQIRQSGGTFDDSQRKQLNSIANYINNRNAAEVFVINQGREAMTKDKGNAGKVREVYEKMQQVSSDLAGKGLKAPGEAVEVGDFIIHDKKVMQITSVENGKPKGAPVTF